MDKPFFNLRGKQTRTALPTKSVEIILTARQNMKISAITDETETFGNCNGVSTDTKQATTPNTVEKVNINKKLPAFVCANLFLNFRGKQTLTALPTKSVEIILTARQNIKISAITDDTETFCNCNGVLTDTKQTTTPNAVEKVHRCSAFQICQVRKDKIVA